MHIKLVDVKLELSEILEISLFIYLFFPLIPSG